jgi:glycosyltransferase involved in cell wall biosynthesis
MTITAIILAKNEEKNIASCIETLTWCDEILLIDDNSTDATSRIAKKLGARIIRHSLNNDFSQQRNFALKHAKSEWVFYVDADERVSDALRDEIRTILPSSTLDAYYVRRVDYQWGKLLRYGETGSMYFLRLARKDFGNWIGRVHESWVSSKAAGKLKEPLFHYPHVTISEFLSEINFYSTLRATELFEQGHKTSGWEIVAYPLGKFLQNALLRLGVLDGMHGIIFAALMSFHSFLVRGKLWLLTHGNTSETA